MDRATVVAPIALEEEKMKFVTDRISTKSISLEDAVKHQKEAKPQPQRTLDEILAGIKTANAVKLAAANTPKVVEAAKVEAPKTEAPKAEVKAEVKTAAVKAEIKVAAELSEKKPEAPKAAPKTAAPKGVTLKVAKTMDFRGWEAKQVVDAWKQHGDVNKCIASVKGKTSDPKTYCSLLRVAAVEAGKVMTKVAESKPAKATKTAEHKKFAKLTANEQAFLTEYFKKLYGEDYVKAMVGDY
jgi:hypothetical protein